jgi:hypothetical protein
MEVQKPRKCSSDNKYINTINNTIFKCISNVLYFKRIIGLQPRNTYCYSIAEFFSDKPKKEENKLK